MHPRVQVSAFGFYIEGLGIYLAPRNFVSSFRLLFLCLSRLHPKPNTSLHLVDLGPRFGDIARPRANM